MTKDIQRNAVYKWEDAVFKTHKLPLLSLQQCKNQITKVSIDYDIPTPRLTDGRGRRSACANKYRIRLPRRTRTYDTVLHECAHTILDWKMAERGKVHHGPHFATLLLTMWYRYLGVAPGRARPLAIFQRPRRVHFAPLKEVPQPVKRVYRIKVPESANVYNLD